MLLHVQQHCLLLLRCEVAEVNRDLSFTLAFLFQAAGIQIVLGFVLIVVAIIIVVILSFHRDGHIAGPQVKLVPQVSLKENPLLVDLRCGMTSDLNLH